MSSSPPPLPSQEGDIPPVSTGAGQTQTPEPPPQPEVKGEGPSGGSSSTKEAENEGGAETGERFHKVFMGEERPKGDEGNDRQYPLASIFSNPKAPEDLPFRKHESEQWGFATKQFNSSRCAMIAGSTLEDCPPLAYGMARDQARVIYHTNSTDIGPVLTREIVEYLLSPRITEPTCVIIQWPRGGESCFIDRFGEFAESVQKLHGIENRSIIVCIHRQALEEIKGHQRITVFKIPESAASVAQEQQGELRAVMEAESGGQILSLADIVAREREQFIATLMARIAVLFPDLTSTNFERLLERAMGNRKLELTPATKDTESDAPPAAAIWRSAKSYFEEQAGLIRHTDAAGVQRVRFRSEKTDGLAQQWAWSDPEALFSIFKIASGMNILFGDLADDEERGMFDAYLAAAVQLAHRSPGLFGARWLETLAAVYAAWVRTQLDEFSQQEWDIFALLGHMVNEVKQRRLWRHFAKRMGRLLNRLFRDGASALVGQFIERLFKQGLHELALRIILEIGEARESKAPEWLRRIIKEGDSAARLAVVREIALDVSWDVPRSAPFMRELCDWRNSENDAVRRAVLAFPAVLFDLVSQKSFDWSGTTSPLAEILAAPCVTGGTVGELCVSFAIAEEFPRGAAEQVAPDKLSPQEEANFALALLTYQHAWALPDADRERALDLCRSVLKPLKLSQRGEVRQWLQLFADQLTANKKRIAAGTAPNRARRIAELDRRYSLCKALIRA